jgi:hypothetical protein
MDLNGFTQQASVFKGNQTTLVTEAMATRAVIGSEKEFANMLTSLVRGEVAWLDGSNGEIKIILSDIGSDRMEKVFKDMLEEIKRLK